jgi:hypothetical protein
MKHLYRVTTHELTGISMEFVDMVELESPLDLKNGGKNVFHLIDQYHQDTKLEDEAEELLEAVEKLLGGKGSLAIAEVEKLTALFNEGLRDAIEVAALVRPKVETAKALWLKSLKAFESAALKLEEAWGALEIVGGEAASGYPFQSTFDEICDDIRIYREGAEKQFISPQQACQCEHAAHFGAEYNSNNPVLTPNGNPGHKYGAESNLTAVKTPFGIFHVCGDCAKDCYREYAEVLR